MTNFKFLNKKAYIWCKYHRCYNFSMKKHMHGVNMTDFPISPDKTINLVQIWLILNFPIKSIITTDFQISQYERMNQL